MPPESDAEILGNGLGVLARDFYLSPFLVLQTGNRRQCQLIGDARILDHDVAGKKRLPTMQWALACCDTPNGISVASAGCLMMYFIKFPLRDLRCEFIVETARLQRTMLGGWLTFTLARNERDGSVR